jgi:hypothetical protein
VLLLRILKSNLNLIECTHSSLIVETPLKPKPLDVVCLSCFVVVVVVVLMLISRVLYLLPFFFTLSLSLSLLGNVRRMKFDEV